MRGRLARRSSMRYNTHFRSGVPAAAVCRQSSEIVWERSNMTRFEGNCLLGVVLLAVAVGKTRAADWPTWRHDPSRSAVSPEALPESLAARWVCRYPAPRPAWHDPRLQFDAAFQPVVAGKMLVFGSSSEDCVIALDTQSGAERWRFFTDGPVRLPPAIENHRVYATSDDGCLYCLDLATGGLVWKFRGATSEQMVLGNERLISTWPARGGPVVHGGVVYFAAGIWPFMGVFVYALDAETGRVIWQNDRPSAAYNDQPGAAASTFGTVSPQGALVVTGGRLAVPSGRAWPAWFDLQSGEMSPHAVGIKDISGGGDSQIAAGGDLIFMGGYVYSMTHQRALLLNASAATVNPFTTLSILDNNTLYTCDGDSLTAHDLSGAVYAKLTGAYGRPLMRCDTKQLWKLPIADRVEVMIKAGPRIYLAGAGWVAAVEVPAGGLPLVSWRSALAGTAGGLLAADDKLFVSTREGSICCFSSQEAEFREINRCTPAEPIAKRAATEIARTVLAQSGRAGGYGILIGIGDDDLAEALIRQAEHHVIMIEANEAGCDRLRKRLAAAGLYGRRAAVLAADAASLPPYLASWIFCRNTRAAGFPSDEVCVKTLFQVLRPYGGVLCLAAGSQGHSRLAAAFASQELPGAQLKPAGEFSLVTREGPLPGAGDWTHDAADAGNTWMGLDRRVKPPLGVLWFGGPAGDPRLFMQRHSDPPTARVCQGRMFMHGDSRITAADVYTGRILWDRELPSVRAFQNLRSNVDPGPPYEKSGETTKRAAVVAHPDGLYLAYGQTLHLWESATGKALAEFTVPASDSSQNGHEKESLFLGDLRLEGDVLVVAADFPEEDRESAFIADDFREIPPDRLPEMVRLVESWAGGNRPDRTGAESDLDFLLRLTNQMLHDPNLAGRIPQALRQQADETDAIRAAVDSAIAAIDRCRAVQRNTFAPYVRIEHANRRLLEAYFPAIRKLPAKIHWHNLYPWDGIATRQLVGLDRRSGKVLWRRHADYAFPHKSIAAGRGKIFCLDRTDLDVDDVLRRRGIAQPSKPRLVALDVRSGREVWSRRENIVGYEMFYSAAHDVLVQAGAFDPSPQDWWNKPRDIGVRFLAYQGEDGRLLWDRTFTLNRPGGGHRMWYNWLLHDDTILLESYRDKDAEFYGFDLLTGELRRRTSPLTGAELPWGFERGGGCTKNVCCPNLVLFRSHAAGYYDIAGDGGTATLGGFRPGCKNSLIPADGLLNAPNYASGCTCNYPVFTSLALIHMPQAEQWSTNAYPYDGGPVRRVGINLGAPGDRRAPGGTVWLDWPSVGGPSPEIPLSVSPAEVNWFYRHSSRIGGDAPGWIVASGGEGIDSMEIRLRGSEENPAAPQERGYLVRLYFAEPENLRPGDRVFSIFLQGNEVIRDLDIIGEAGTNNLGLVKECRGVRISDILNLRLVPKTGKTLLCGIELIAEE